MKRTKIIITLGPALTRTKKLLKRAIAESDAVRLNFSHILSKDVQKNIELIRKIDVNIPIIGDISGPKIRIINLSGGKLEIKKGDIFTLKRTNLNFPEVFDSLKLNHDLLFDDAKLKAKIIKKNKDESIIKFLNKHILLERKAISFPHTHIKLSPLSEIDKEKIKIAVKTGIDYFFLSFVNDVKGLKELKSFLHSLKVNIPVIAKIETVGGVKNYKKIILNSDGMLVARGDLGIEMSLVKVPIIQKKLVEFANEHGKISIVATQVLDSMIENPTPLRAEMSDITMMIEEKVDVIMLTSETSIGKYPLRTLKYLERAIIENEKYYTKIKKDKNISICNNIFPQTAVIAKSMYLNSEENDSKIIANISRSGLTSLLVSKYRPRAKIVTLTDNKKTFRRVRLYWNTFPLFVSKIQMIPDSKILPILKNKFKLKPNNIVIISRDQPINKGKVTNSFAVYYLKKEKQKIIEKYPVSLDMSKCILCNKCVSICPFDIFKREKGEINIYNEKSCIKDKLCENICPKGAIKIYEK